MAPSIDCPASLYCSEDVSENGWDDESNGFIDDLTDDLGEVIHPALQRTILQFPEQAIAALVEKEARHMPEADYLDRFHTKNLDLNVRQALVNWLLKVQAFHNFGALSVSLAVNYLDRFLSRHELPDESEWKVQLLAVACMSLAAKMEETEVPFLLDLQVGDVSHYFEARTVQRMELLVLSTLEWRMSAITPFSYIDYFFAKLEIDNTIVRSVLLRVIDLLLGSLRDVNFLAFRPSVIAAAAVLSALDELAPVQGSSFKKILCETCDLVRTCGLRPESPRSLRACPCSSEMPNYVRLGLTPGAVVRLSQLELEGCLFLMQDVMIELSPQRCFKRRILNLSSVPQSPVGVLEAASYSCASDGAQSCEASASSMSGTTASAPKRRRKDGLCNSLFTFEAL